MSNPARPEERQRPACSDARYCSLSLPPTLYNAPMFLHDTGDPARTLAIPQASHAWLAWQLAEHWGNRRFNRPLPRAEVLAAVMLHDSGWSSFDVAPGIDEDGKPRTFDRMEVESHLRIWRESVDRTALVSRYAGLLVANHFCRMAEVKSADLLGRGDTSAARLAESFRAEMDRREASWIEGLAVDARYQDCLAGPRRESNADILTLCDRISVYLCAALASQFEIEGPRAEGGCSTVRLTAIDRTHWRVEPWPMEGDRVRLQCEGRLLPRVSFDSADEFHGVLRCAPVERLSFTLLRSSAVG
jgi:hypothetical protein